MSEGTTDICQDSVISWCLANGLSGDQADVLDGEGVESFSFFDGMSEDDRFEIASETLALRKIKAQLFVKATDEVALSVFAQAIQDGIGSKEYKKLLKEARRVKLVTPSATATADASSASAEPGAGATISAKAAVSTYSDDSKMPDDAVKTPERPTFDKGVHVVPHRVVVMDREKAMRDNPAFKRRDFCTLAELPPFDDSDLKIILVVGATGSGKSTTINSLMNYLYGVKFSDEWRVKLIQERDKRASSSTCQVIGYLIETPPALDGKSLLIIDTPGFGDTRGIARDDETIAEVREFFKTHVLYLNAICFVVKASDTSVCPFRKHVYNQVLSLFGNDVSEIITMLFTFSDGTLPPAIAIIKKQKIEYSKYFKLNNSEFYTTAEESEFETVIESMYWSVGISSFKKLCDHVTGSRDVSLERTRKC